MELPCGISQQRIDFSESVLIKKVAMVDVRQETDEHYMFTFQTNVTEDYNKWASVLFTAIMTLFNDKTALIIEADKDPENYEDLVLRVETEFSVSMQDAGVEAKAIMSVLHVAKKLTVNKTKLRKAFEAASDMSFPLCTIQKRCIPNQLLAGTK